MRERQAIKQTQSCDAMQRGVSLIEVLIVLVILTLGIFTIIQLFPGGFLTIRSVQNSTVAARLGKAVVEGLVQNNSALPDAILTGYSYSAGSDLDQAILTGQMYSDNSDPDDPASLNTARYISNETITVPSSGIYVVNYGPIDTTAQGFFVKGFPWAVESDDSAGPFQPSDLSSGQQIYTVDYANGKIGFPTASYNQPNCELTVDGGQHYVVFTLKTTDSGQWLDAGKINAFAGVSGTLTAGPWTPGQVIFRRVFHSVTNFDNDPFEYTLPSSGDIPSSGPAANIGAVNFNPAASGANGAKPLKAQISYTTYDWSIIHEDRDVPMNSNSSLGLPLRLSLTHLKEENYTQTDGTAYTGVVPGVSPGSGQDVIVVDLDTGFFVPCLNSQINYGSGLITLDSAYNGSRVRIFYKAENDWTVAVQKAPRSYQWGSNTTPAGSVAAATYQFSGTTVYFPRSDAGKTIEIDGIPTSSGTTSLTQSLPLADKLYNYVSIDLSKDIPTVSPASASATTAPFTSVRGLSSRAVVAYRERDGNYRMRTVDTVLTRNP